MLYMLQVQACEQNVLSTGASSVALLHVYIVAPNKGAAQISAGISGDTWPTHMVRFLYLASRFFFSLSILSHTLFLFKFMTRIVSYKYSSQFLYAITNGDGR